MISPLLWIKKNSPELAISKMLTFLLKTFSRGKPT